MTLIEFREWIFYITDFIYVTPVFLAIFAYKNLTYGQKWLVFYFIIYFIANILTEILVSIFRKNNSYFGFIYSFADCVLLYFFFLNTFQNRRHLKLNKFVFTVAFFAFFIDLFWISGFNNIENYFSEVVISICICCVCIYYFSIYFTKKVNSAYFNEIDLFLVLSLLLKFFLKAIYSFFNKYLYETQANYYLLAQVDNYYNLFSIISLLISSFVFFHLVSNKNQIVNV